MRKMILIAAATMLLAPVAQAGGSRSLSLSTDDTSASVASRATDGRRAADATNPAATTPAPVAAAPAMQAAIAAVAPAPVVAATTPAQAAPTAPATAAPDMRQTERVRPSHRTRAGRPSRPEYQRWTRNRIIGELHRHGIYW
jgi:hypothetical protein